MKIYRRKKELFSILKAGVFIAVIVFIVRSFLFAPTLVWGESMQPTFADRDRIIVNKMARIDRFDVVVFEAPDSDEYYVKRVIGLPGDRIEYKNEMLYLNGEQVEEPYLSSDPQSKNGFRTGDFTLEELTGYQTVPENAYFVLGDNRLNSNDSRFFGFLNKDAVVGEVSLRFYPLANFGIPR